MKYYAVFAVRKKDPSDVLGLVEYSFDMGWSREHVRLWTPVRTGLFATTAQKTWNHIRYDHVLSGRCAAEIDRRKYKIVQCRVNSSFCPVKVDTSVRDSGRQDVDKYEYRNAPFRAL